MFVDVLWEQTAAALSLQSVVRAFLTRRKFTKVRMRVIENVNGVRVH